MSENPWNSLEVAKLVVGVLTPVLLAVIGWFVNRRLKQIEDTQWATQKVVEKQLEQTQWANQKLIEKRLLLYDEICPLLNRLLCFYTWVGYWKDVSPVDVVDSKRSLDKTVNIYRHVLGEAFYNEYQSFIKMLFVTYTGPGHDATIRSHIDGSDGDRTKDCNYQWDRKWERSFSDAKQVEPKQKVTEQYYKLMNTFKNSIGIH